MERIIKLSSELNTGMNSLLKVALPKDLRLRQDYSCIYFLKFTKISQGWRTLALEPLDPCWDMEREKSIRG